MSERQDTQASDALPDPGFDPAEADGAFQVRDRAGALHRLPGIAGYRLMEIMRDFGLPIAASCGGAAACGTCHVYIDAGWLSRLEPPRADEEAQLDQLLAVQPASRLACQIIWDEATLDGLSLTLAPEEE